MSKYYVETISPIHIGNGYKYSNNEFLIKGNLLKRADIEKLYDSFREEEIKEFILSLEEPGFSLKMFLGGAISTDATLYTATFSSERIPTEIVEYIKTNNKPYIPGSSIKGAIRTALLYHLIDYDIAKLKRLIFENYNKKMIIIESNKIFNRLLSGKTRDTSSSDILRFLNISDSNYINKLEIICEQIIEGGPEIWNWYRARNKIVQSYLEALPINTKIEGNFRTNYDNKLFKQLEIGNNENLLNFGKIKEIIYTFSNDIIIHELDFAKKYKIDFLYKFYDNIQKLNTKNEPLMRIGHGSGFLMTTIGLKLKDDKYLFDKIRMMTRGNTYRYEFPKSRKIDVDKNVPLGWCKLDLR